MHLIFGIEESNVSQENIRYIIWYIYKVKEKQLHYENYFIMYLLLLG